MDLTMLEAPALVGLAGLVILGIGERALQVVRLAQPDSPTAERWSLYWLQASYVGAVILGLLDATVLHWTTASASYSRWTYLGIPLVIGALIVRGVARWTLGRNFSGRVQTSSEHRLVTDGIYRWVQHPAYLAYLGFVLGFPLCFGSWSGLAIGLLGGVPALVYRISIEEAALATWFGEDYRNYQRRTARLVPFVW